MQNPVSTQINKNNKVVITPISEQADLEDVLYAINWFNVKRLWMYNLYNMLVAGHVKKLGAKAIYKGIGTQKINIENEELDRRMLLVVMYPSVNSFMKLVSNKLFLLKSIFRVNSVSDFNIGFSKRIDQGTVSKEPTRLYKGDNHYLIHTFKGSKSEVSLPNSDEINCFFYGVKVAQIGRQKDGEQLENAPLILDGVIIWESDSREELLNFIEKSDYKDFKKELGESNLYLQKRIV